METMTLPLCDVSYLSHVEWPHDEQAIRVFGRAKKDFSAPVDAEGTDLKAQLEAEGFKLLEFCDLVDEIAWHRAWSGLPVIFSDTGLKAQFEAESFKLLEFCDLVDEVAWHRAWEWPARPHLGHRPQGTVRSRSLQAP